MSFEDLSNQLFDYIINVAEGKRVKSESLSKAELAIFKDGVTL
jgi:altronate dehydratase